MPPSGDTIMFMSLRAVHFLTFLLIPLYAQDLKINMGPRAGSVLQRDNEGRAKLQFAGSAARTLNDKYVEARVVTDKGEALVGHDWKALEKIKNAAWSGVMNAVPQGGPYTLEVRVAGSASAADAIKDLYIGDLWLLAGQSNMQGVGLLTDVEQPDPRIRSFDQSDRWVLATEPIHQLVNAADRVHWRGREKMEGQELEQWIAARKTAPV